MLFLLAGKQKVSKPWPIEMKVNVVRQKIKEKRHVEGYKDHKCHLSICSV